MNAPFDQSDTQLIEALPAPSGSRRLMLFLKSAICGSLFIIAGLYAAQLLVPARFFPANFIIIRQ